MLTIMLRSTVSKCPINKFSSYTHPKGLSLEERIAAREKDWRENPRWKGIKRRYSAADVEKIKGTLDIEYTLAKRGSAKLWQLFHSRPFVKSLGALTGNQAMQARAGLEATFASGWQVAADANDAGAMYPDQSLYPSNSVPLLVSSINRTFQRADQIQHAEALENKGMDAGVKDWFLPIIADAEAGFGGVLNAFELMKAMIEAGAAAVHFEDQLASAKKCGHMGGKVLVPTCEAVDKLVAGRLAADMLGVETIIIARTDGEAANLLTSDIDPNDRPFLTTDGGRQRTPEGFFRTKPGLDQSISRALAYAPYAELLWMETATPDVGFAKAFSEGVKEKFPEKMFAYNCSPSFNWSKNLSPAQIATFQDELGALGYKYQFITIAGFHVLNYSMFDLSHNYAQKGMTAYVEDVQEKEFAARERGYTAVAHQREVGTGYFDTVTQVIQQGASSTCALKGSTEEEQFVHK